MELILTFLVLLGIIVIAYEQSKDKSIQLKQNELLTKIVKQSEGNNLSILKTQKDICQVLNNSNKFLERIANNHNYLNNNQVKEKRNYKKPEEFESLVL